MFGIESMLERRLLSRSTKTPSSPAKPTVWLALQGVGDPWSLLLEYRAVLALHLVLPSHSQRSLAKTRA